MMVSIKKKKKIKLQISNAQGKKGEVVHVRTFCSMAPRSAYVRSKYGEIW